MLPIILLLQSWKAERRCYPWAQLKICHQQDVNSWRRAQLTEVKIWVWYHSAIQAPLLLKVLTVFLFFRPLFCLFLLFSRYNFNTNWKKRRWCAWDPNPGPQDGRRRRSYGGHPNYVSFELFVLWGGLL